MDPCGNAFGDTSQQTRAVILGEGEGKMEEKMPLVSIIMSVYNEERYIQKSLDSVLSQTLDNFELIIIDDCSTDKTTEMLEG